MRKRIISLILFSLFLLLLTGCELPKRNLDIIDLLLDKNTVSGILSLARDEQNNKILTLKDIENDWLKEKILVPLGAGTGSKGIFEVKLLYVSKRGTSGGDAKSWKTARDNVHSVLSELVQQSNPNPPSPTQIYLILVAVGTYEPKNLTESYGFKTKNHIGMIGGWDSNHLSGRDDFSQTIFSGKNSMPVFQVDPSEVGFIYGSVIKDGMARENGGGILNGGTLYLTNVKLESNSATKNGGGLYNTSTGKAVLENVIFRKNTATLSGGGFYDGSGIGSLKNILFTENVAGNEGGGFANSSNTSQLSFINTTISNNKASKGGGISNNGSIFILNSTIVKNSASVGSGIYGDGLTNSKIKLLNSIVWRNTGGPQIQITPGGQVRAAYSIIQNFIPPSRLDESSPKRRGIYSLEQSQVFTKTDSIGVINPLVKSSLEKNIDDVYITHGWDGEARIETENKGVYIKKGTGEIYYYGESKTQWFSIQNLGDATPPSMTPPSSATDIVGKDARGYERLDRPDLGAYELLGKLPQP